MADRKGEKGQKGEKGAAVRAENIPVAALSRNPRNPRKHFDPEKLKELVASVKARGVLQPILVRPDADGYELVAGERRWKAAQAAGLAEIPAVIRELDDEAAFEISVIENSHREDVNPLDEAEAFAAWLVRAKIPGARAVEELAAKVGHPPAYVRRRLALCALGAAGKEKFHAGELLLGPALMLARLPEKAQKKVLARCREEGLGAREIVGAIEVEAARLDQAPFAKDGCASCANNGESQPDLYGESEQLEGRCLKPDCFAKKMAEWKQAETEKFEARGIKVLVGQAAGRLNNYRHATELREPRKECASCPERAAFLRRFYNGTRFQIYCLKPSCYEKRERGGKEDGDGDNGQSPSSNPAAIKSELKRVAAEFAAAWTARTLAFDETLWPMTPGPARAILARALHARSDSLYSSSAAWPWLRAEVGAAATSKDGFTATLSIAKLAELSSAKLAQALAALSFFGAAVFEPKFPWPAETRAAAAKSFPLQREFLDAHVKSAIEKIAKALGVKVAGAAKRQDVIQAILAAKLPPGTLTPELAEAFGQKIHHQDTKGTKKKATVAKKGKGRR